MVALLKPREQRHCPLGPIHQDQPLKVFDEDAADLAQNMERLRAARSWWPDIGAAIAVLLFSLWLKWGR